MTEKIEHFYDEEEKHLVPVTILDATKIGHGGYGTIFKVTASIQDAIKRVAVKEYPANQKVCARKAVNGYLAAKRAGMKTLPVYLLSQTGTRILMTLHDTNEVSLVDGKPAFQAEQPEQDKMDRIEGFETLIDEYFHQSILAARAGIEFKMDDVFHFTIDKETKSHMDFWVQDFDLFELPTRNYTDVEKKGILKRNLDASRDSINFVLNTRVKDPMRSKYLAQVESKYQELIATTIPAP